MQFYLLDDSTKLPIRNELRKFAKANNITYLHRDDRKGFKAGALNNMLKAFKGGLHSAIRLRRVPYKPELFIRSASIFRGQEPSHTYRRKRGTSRDHSSLTQLIFSMHSSSSSCSLQGLLTTLQYLQAHAAL
jgi:hypothetical protein